MCMEVNPYVSVQYPLCLLPSLETCTMRQIAICYWIRSVYVVCIHVYLCSPRYTSSIFPFTVDETPWDWQCCVCCAGWQWPCAGQPAVGLPHPPAAACPLPWGQMRLPHHPPHLLHKCSAGGEWKKKWWIYKFNDKICFKRKKDRSNILSAGISWFTWV